MDHSLVRALTVITVIQLIIKKYNVDENTAMEMFYKSHLAALYFDDDSGLYGQSPNYIFGLFEDEQAFSTNNKNG